jgi:hypothetical protein
MTMQVKGKKSHSRRSTESNILRWMMSWLFIGAGCAHNSPAPAVATGAVRIAALDENDPACSQDHLPESTRAAKHVLTGLVYGHHEEFSKAPAVAMYASINEKNGRYTVQDTGVQIFSDPDGRFSLGLDTPFVVIVREQGVEARLLVAARRTCLGLYVSHE